MKPVHWRASARRDLDDAAAWYAQQGGIALELRFIAAAESTALLVREHPKSGSMRHADEVPEIATLVLSHLAFVVPVAV